MVLRRDKSQFVHLAASWNRGRRTVEWKVEDESAAAGQRRHHGKAS